jgi:glutamate synthase (NADPH/NADH) small chain
MKAEGTRFRTGVDVGVDLPAKALLGWFDAIVLAGGATAARDINVPGRDLSGVHFAMDFLTQQNKRMAGDTIPKSSEISAKGKRVVVIGGGDTGSDCVGTCHRQGAVDITQLELMPRPPEERDRSTPWPNWPLQLRTSHAHEEGCRREWSVMTTSLVGENGRLQALRGVRAEPDVDAEGRVRFVPVKGSDFVLEADLVLLAMGFTGPARSPLLDDLGVKLDGRGNVATGADRMTSVHGVFAAGDMRRGASLIVWAIREGRDVAKGVERWLKSSAAHSAMRAAR